ncbi:hypothetical protein CS542_10510 [Pedobacter sp. IW39]|nr:hypothetical protein CS542_10510 [Pedobacter sp. IW39]
MELLSGLNYKCKFGIRFDRVAEMYNGKTFTLIRKFWTGTCFIVGTWPQDEQLIVALISAYPQWKFIITT